MTEAFEIRSRIICEEVRQEKSNKYMLLGVFPGDIYVEKLPAQSALALYFEGRVAQPGEYPFFIKISGPGEGAAIISIRYESNVPNGTVALVTPRYDVSLEKEGTLKIETSEDQQEWTTQIERQVRIGEGLWKLVPDNSTERDPESQ